MKYILGDTWMLPFQPMEIFEPQWHHGTGTIKPLEQNIIFKIAFSSVILAIFCLNE